MKWPQCRVWNSHLRGYKVRKQKSWRRFIKVQNKRQEVHWRSHGDVEKPHLGRKQRLRETLGGWLHHPLFVMHASSVLSHSTCDVISSADIHEISGYAGSWDQWRHPRGWISGPFCAVNMQVAPSHPATVGPQPSPAPSARDTGEKAWSFLSPAAIL